MKTAHRCLAARATAATPRAADPAARAGRSGGAMVWLPWACAPAFALLPIAGCGLAGTLAAPAPAARTAQVAKAPHQPLLPGPRDPRLVRIGAVMPTALPRR